MTDAIQSHEFDNGLVLIGESMPWLESVAFTFLVPSGSVYDPGGKSGLAGYVCEMMLRGAGERDNRQFLTDLERLGVSGSESVTTSHTAFAAHLLADVLPQTLGMYADLLLRPRFPEDELEAGRLVMQQELEAVDDDPQHKLMLELKRRYYPPPWNQPVTGDAAGIAAITMEDIRQHWEYNYRPNGAMIGVAGRMDFERVKDLVGELFGDWKPNRRKKLVERKAKVKNDHIPFESKQTQIGVAYPSVPTNHPDHILATAAVTALSGSMYSRLFSEVREKRGLCYSVYASQHLLKDRGTILCYAGSAVERAQETLDVLLAELVRLGDGVNAQEVNRVKALAKRNVVMAQESSTSRSSALVGDWYHLGHARSLDEVSRMFDKLSRKKINDYLAQHPPANFTVLTMGPQPLEVHIPTPSVKSKSQAPAAKSKPANKPAKVKRSAKKRPTLGKK